MSGLPTWCSVWPCCRCTRRPAGCSTTGRAENLDERRSDQAEPERAAGRPLPLPRRPGDGPGRGPGFLPVDVRLGPVDDAVPRGPASAVRAETVAGQGGHGTFPSALPDGRAMNRTKAANPKLRPGEVRLTAGAIVDLLAQRHAEDVFVPECKDGPSQSASHLRMDAWAMRKSWANPLVTAYEVKVSRSDFVGDDKWHGYLPNCNEFYFACPANLIRPDELPLHVGLMYASATGSRLFTKKKAVRRDAEIPESVYRYILMCRVKVQRGWQQPASDKAAFWRRWMETREVD